MTRKTSPAVPAVAAAISLVAALLAGSCSSVSREPSSPVSSRPPAGTTAPVKVPSNGWPEEKKAEHALSRLAYGPRPGEVREVAASGVAAWISAQLDPGSLPDPSTDARVEALPAWKMSIAELQRAYPAPRPAREAGAAGAAGVAASAPPRREGPARVVEQLTAARLVRAVSDRRQLREVLVDFWFNHFNVFAGKGEDRWMILPYERDAIRPHVFGRFRDLLEATATHPAMLWYLDNWTSTGEGPAPRGARRGLNENYARELLELHTLGVDGGYTQRDVREVARCFTGWSIEAPRGGAGAKASGAGSRAGTFVFRAAAHDRGPKLVLGTALPAGGGIEDGRRVLDLLAAHPSTARRVATKLCRRFVADEPPRALVDAVAGAFLASGGDLRATYTALFSSPLFWSDEAFLSKTKTPLEYAASSIRALGGATDGGTPLSAAIAQMGEPLFRCTPPTGWPDDGDSWIGTGALVARMNFAASLAAGRIRGTTAAVRGEPDAALRLGGPGFQRR